MRIRGRALMIAVAAGFVVQAVLSIASNAISFAVMGGAEGLRSTTGLPLGATLVSLVACLCLLAVDAGVGLLYTAIASREGALTAGDGALGGGVAGAIEGLLGGILGAIIAAVLFPTMGSMLPGMPSDLTDGARVGLAVGGILGGAIGVCIAIFRGALLAALGGAVGASIFKPKAAAPTTH